MPSLLSSSLRQRRFQSRSTLSLNTEADREGPVSEEDDSSWLGHSFLAEMRKAEGSSQDMAHNTRIYMQPACSKCFTDSLPGVSRFQSAFPLSLPKGNQQAIFLPSHTFVEGMSSRLCCLACGYQKEGETTVGRDRPAVFTHSNSALRAGLSQSSPSR